MILRTEENTTHSSECLRVWQWCCQFSEFPLRYTLYMNSMKMQYIELLMEKHLVQGLQ